MGGIFGNLGAALERKETGIGAYTWGELFPWATSRSGIAVNIDSAVRVTTVLACARVLAEGIAQIPLRVMSVDEKGAKTPATDHPLYRLLSVAPNDFMTSFEFREMLMLHAVLTGNGYAYIGRSRGKIRELIPLVCTSVKPKRARDYTLSYEVNDGQGVTTLSADAVFHLRGPSWDGYLGMDAVQLAREAIGLAIATEESHSALHANGAMPGGVLSIKGKLDDAARERLKAAWVQHQEGLKNKFKTAVLDMDASWTPMAATGVDAQHLETRKFQIEEICRAMRVFPQMVGHTDKTATFASAEAFFLAHVIHSLMPWIRRWEEKIDASLLPSRSEDIYTALFNVRALLRGDANSTANYYKAALGAGNAPAWMTQDEVRDCEGLNPMGGDAAKLPALSKPAAPQPAKAEEAPDDAAQEGQDG
jgi:HK97 family phage portal protein